MRILIVGFTLAFLSVIAAAQAPRLKPAAAKSVSKPTGTLAQVMRGIYFPNANLIFDVQQKDPGAPPKKASDGSRGSTTETFAGIYAGWQVVENAAIALTESVDLIVTPGRLCQNGKRVPVERADFQKYAQGMREAGLAALKIAQTKNLEKMIDVTNQVADACANCHEVYRDKGEANSPARCTP
jgi:Cytochrome C'